MDNFGEILKKARKDKGLTQEALANLIGVTRNAITNYEKHSNTPTLKNMDKLSSVLGVNLSNQENNIKPIPITGTASCGSTELNCLQDNQMKTSINENKWNKDLYAVIACGDSMFPHIKDGAELIIDPTVKPTHGDTVLYKLEDEYAVKILTINKEAHIMEFVPLNPSEDFKTRMIRLDDEDTLSKLTVHYVLKINNPPEYNRSALLKMIGR